ncbi:MAG: sulfotransferase [Bacteroidota bacterium]|nr:sulfotransferase [Bacteroidota bacterium]
MHWGRSRYIFVIGSGRSGTNYLGRVIGKHPDVKMMLEDSRTFKKSVSASVQHLGDEKKYRDLKKTYKRLQWTIFKPVILEKSHTNLWIVEKLAKDFPDALFVGIQRDVYQTVYSMVNHKGVKRWFDLLGSREQSPFLGINKGNREFYEDLPIESKCAIRWLSHQKRLEGLKAQFPDRVHIVDYDQLVRNFDGEVLKLSEFTSLDLLPHAEKPRFQPLNKWKNFSDTAIAHIDEILERETHNPHYFVG